MKKPEILPDVERIFNEYVKDPVAVYKDYGSGFVRFGDEYSGKMFTISVKEYVPRVKKIKKVTFKPDVI